MKRADRTDGRRFVCARAWEIEAVRDGRLSRDHRDTLGRHAETCAECRAQTIYLDGLGRALRGLDVPEPGDVALRRARQSVLSRVDAELAGRGATTARLGRTRGALPWLAAGAVLLVAVVSFLRIPTPPVATAPRTVLEAVDEGGAQWTQRSDGEIDRIDLKDGTLRLRVKKARGGNRLVVHVPDGEIEDVGTTFHVVVSDGRTERVAVDEGRVVLYLLNRAPITLSSGQTWDRPSDDVPIPLLAASVRPPPVATTSTPRSPPTSSQPRAPSLDPTATSRPPANAELEDAAYLHALQLLREGRDAEAKAAAREYLRAFPNGFRREEMGRFDR